jgi:hypothetical protein
MFQYKTRSRNNIIKNTSIPLITAPVNAKRTYETRPSKMIDFKETDYASLYVSGSAVLVKMNGFPKIIMPMNKTDVIAWSVASWFSGEEGKRMKIEKRCLKIVDALGDVVKIGADKYDNIILYNIWQ